MNNQRLKINWKYTIIILQCTFCIMGQQLNDTSKLKNVMLPNKIEKLLF